MGYLGFVALVCGSLLAGACKSTPPKTNPAAATAASAPRQGLEPSSELRQSIQQALADKGPDYVARTRHKDASGAPLHTNRLILEASPYLLQHAHNPVNWFSWGPEALALAKALKRPIFLSVGYSTCHWCHVMEEESFEDEEIAAYINAHYIPIKVDREQRPDIDSVYMTAVQVLTRRGGWPMSVWLTPSLEPFFGGTYFPARDGDRGSRVGFLSLLKRNADEYTKDPAGVASKATQLAAQIKAMMKPSADESPLSASVLERAAAMAERRFDPALGGNRGAPKFPSSFPVRLLLRLGKNDLKSKPAAMAKLTLEKIARGGIYDHVGGGFHRYSTDAKWLVPHFEKMLYDNALLTLAYLEASQLTHSPEFEVVARETLDYIAREMTAPNGGFYSATDADSLTPSGHREEGYFFTWRPSELKRALGAEDAQFISAAYGVTARGNFEKRNILHLVDSPAVLAKAQGLTEKAWYARLATLKPKLRIARKERAAPLRDDKIQSSWNGLMLSAFARAARTLGSKRYEQVARKNADFLLKHLRTKGRLRHSILGQRLGKSAFLEDYTFLADGLLELFEATSEARYLREAISLMEELEKYYADQVSGGYFLTASDQSELLVREKPDTDKAIPSGNSLALLVQLKLHELTGAAIWKERAEMTLRAFSKTLAERPLALSEMLLGVDFYFGHVKEVVIVTAKDAPGDSLEGFQQSLRSNFLPNQVTVIGTQAELEQKHAALMPWVKGKPARGPITAYVCEQGSCQLPTNDPKVFLQQLRK